MTEPRKGQAPPFPMSREEFGRRFRRNFHDPAFEKESEALARLEAIAWEGYEKDRKAPRTAKAGPGFHDPGYDLSVEWRATHDSLVDAEKKQKDPATRSRVLLICGSSRNDGSCPGEISKTWRLAKISREVFEGAGLEVDLLDLSRLTSDYALRIHPCKGCVSTAQPLCHWPCSCYPNHAFNQVNDWMAEIYERWVAAHGVMLLTPVNWYHTSSTGRTPRATRSSTATRPCRRKCATWRARSPPRSPSCAPESSHGLTRSCGGPGRSSPGGGSMALGVLCARVPGPIVLETRHRPDP